MVFSSPAVVSVLWDTQGRLVTKSRLTKMETLPLSMVTLPSVTGCTLYGPFVRHNILRLSFVTLFSKWCLYLVSGTVGLLFASCVLRDGRQFISDQPAALIYKI